MLRHRIIPVLLLHEEGLVKTKQFKSPVYIGDPINVINIFNDKEVDELIFLDIDATKRNLPINFDLIEDIASECFMPFAYGGGIKHIEDIERLFYLGVEKVIINTSLKNKELIKEAVRKFGSQSIVASIDVKRSNNGEYRVYSYKDRQMLNINIQKYLKEIEQMSVGEIFVNDVDNDGIMQGYDIDLFEKISSHIKIPIIACGGAGNLNDLKKIIENSEVSAIGAGSIFVFYGIHNAVLITYPKYEELKLLEKQIGRI